MVAREMTDRPSAPRPYTLIAELTYKCPLKCPYCSNPVALRESGEELDTEGWKRAMAGAEEVGALQVHFTGGEPLVRRDLEELVAEARRLDLYTNLITSGVPLERSRLEALAEAGLDNVQLSFQHAHAEENDRIAGTPSFERKIAVARWVKELGLPLTFNVVLHRGNIDDVPALAALAEGLRADRLELANAQYLGWALENRAALLPSRASIDRAREAAREVKARASGRMEVVFVLPDYVSDFPKACMEGWARKYVHMSPDGRVLPCHAAHTLPGLDFERVGARSLPEIWRDNEALNRFRGSDWMEEPCRGCDRKEVDFGGCRCQAFNLTGSLTATDPACSRAPAHALVEEARATAEGDAPRRYLYRGPPRV